MGPLPALEDPAVDASEEVKAAPQAAERRGGLSAVLLTASEWRWSMVLAHWMRAAVFAANAPSPSSHPSASPAFPSPAPSLASTLSALFTLAEHRLSPFLSLHSSLARRLRSKPPPDDLAFLAHAGLPPSDLSLYRQLTLIAVTTHTAAFASSSTSFLTRAVVPLLSSPLPVVRRLGAMALGNAGHELVGQLLQILQPLEAAIEERAGAKREGGDSLRVHLSHIYRLLSESHPPSSQAASPFIERALRWVESTYSFLAITGNEFRWDLLELRRHFCVVVERFALTTAACQPCPLSEAVRRRLFSLLLAWCGHGPSSSSYSQKLDRHAEELLSKVKGSGGRSAAQMQAAAQAPPTRWRSSPSACAPCRPWLRCCRRRRSTRRW